MHKHRLLRGLRRGAMRIGLAAVIALPSVPLPRRTRRPEISARRVANRSTQC